MDNNQAATSTPVNPKSTMPGIFGTKVHATIAFGVGVLLYLLPLSELKCAGQKIASKSGITYAMGKEWKVVSSGMFGSETKKDQSSDFSKEKKGNTQILAIAAIGLGVLGLLLCMGAHKSAHTGGLVSGVLAAGASIALMIDQKSNFAKALKLDALDKGGDVSEGFDKIGNTLNNAKLELGFTMWFYLAVTAFLAAAFFCYKRMQSEKNNL